MNIFRLVLVLMFSMFANTFLFAKAVHVHKNIDYVKSSVADYDPVRHKLDVYEPKKGKSTGKVLVFIHGGSWDTGKKESYRFLGKAFAKNGIVTVVINYRLSPSAKYEAITYDCARAIAWVKDSISNYGGNAKEIFVAGHSAGGHLAALLCTDATFFKKVGIENPIKGCILNDPFGLDMYTYLDHGYKGDASFRVTFTNAPNVWKKGSPMYYVSKTSIPYYIIRGGNTYPAIISDSKKFHELNIALGNQSELHIVKKKTHIPMVLLYFRKNNKELKKTVDFMNSH